jgi:autotransporter-associated beta strand protein
MKIRKNCFISSRSSRLGMVSAACLFAGLIHQVPAEILVQWVPAAGDESVSEYYATATLTGPGVTASTVARVNQPRITNAGAVWPGYVANRPGVGSPGSYDPVNDGYTQFTLSPVAGGQFTLSTITYGLNSYGGMNDQGGYTGVVRTSQDDFASELTTHTLTQVDSGTFAFDVAALGPITEPLTIRIYFVNNEGSDNWADLSTAGGGLVVNGTASARRETITWSGQTDDTWTIGGPEANWVSSDGTFQSGDHVVFSDVVDPLFSGTIQIIGSPLIGSITADHSTIPYTLAGVFGGNGAFTKNGTETFTLLAPANSLPFSGPITVNAGTLELAGNTNALSNVPLVTINSGGTFRYASGNAGQDSNVAFSLAGGTLAVDDDVFTWPDNKGVTLTENTTSTIDTGGTFFLYFNRISGSGNLLKTGSGTLEATADYAGIRDLLTHTGTTEIQDGLIRIGAFNTAASSAWHINGGTLQLIGDAAEPIANLAPTTAVTLSEGTLDIRSNVETIGSLKLGGGTCIITPETKLTVTGGLDLSGGETEIVAEGFSGNGPFIILKAGSITGPLSNLKTQTRGGVFAFENGNLTLTTTPATVKWTAAFTDTWEVGGMDANWSSDDGTFQQDDNIIFDDTVDPLFSGQVFTSGTPRAGTITANNAEVDYILSGPFNGTSFTKSGSGRFTLQAAGGAHPLAGPIVVNEGVLELAGNTNALSNVPRITVNPGGTFRFAPDNDGQDSNVPFTLAGGTLAVDDLVFTWPDNKSIQLADDTTSTIATGSQFYIYNNRITGSGGLLKTGSGLLSADATSGGILDLLTYTGSTEIREGTFVVGASNTAASLSWNITGGELRLNNDSASPIANLPADVAVTISSGALDLRGNTETIASLTVSGGTLRLDGGSLLTITDALDLTAGELFLEFDGFESPGQIDIIQVGSINGPLSNLKSNVAGGSFSYVGGVLTLTSTDLGAATTITVDSIVTTAGTTPGTTKATLNFTANGAVDIYASGDLSNWGTPIASGLSASTFEEDNLPTARRFYVIVGAGQTYPSAP